jgi:diaminopimelate decarboxylase
VLLGTQAVRTDGALEIGGCSTVELAERFGTPLYVIDESEVRARCRAYREAFAKHYPGTASVAYAAKAFQTLAMCRIVDEEGLWMDVCSGGELACALRAGFPAERLFYHGNYKTETELAEGIEAGVGSVVLDCLEEIARIESLKPSRPVPALVRVTPGIDTHTHDKFRVAVEDTKFGFGVACGAAMGAIRRALASDAVDLKGIHAHIGSQILSTDFHRESAAILADFCVEIREQTGYVVEVLNLGGGLGIRYLASQDPPSIDEFVRDSCAVLVEGFESRGFPLPRIVVEPGRSIIGEAGTLLYRVGVVKDVPDTRTYVTVDGGLSDNPRPALYDAHYTVLLANRMNETADTTVTVAGKHCETDVLHPDVKLPSVRVGDLLAVPGCGAYTFAMSSNYNQFPRRAVVLVRDGEAELVSAEQSYDDMLAGQCIPERLRPRA